MKHPDPARRRFLTLGGRGALLALAWPAVRGLSGCADGADGSASATLEIPLTALPEGVRQRYLLAGIPLEIQRRGEQVVARSLLCTHQGCEVRWEAEADRYLCPCHDGSFDAEGRVLGGPPTRPLRTIPVHVRDQLVIVGP